MSTSTLFDEVRQHKGITSDAELARQLGVSQCVLSQARGKNRISAGMILRVVEFANWQPAKVRELLAQTTPQQYHDKPPQVSVTEASQ